MAPQVTPRRMVLERVVAQLAIIVVGVLLALWADAWVAARGERTVEAARLEALRTNVAATLEALREFDEGVEGTKLALRRLLSPAARDRTLPNDTLQALVLRAFLDVPSFDAQMNVYDDLKNSGQLALLRDPEIRQALAALDAHLQHIHLAQADLATVQQLNLDPYVIRRLDLPRLQGRYLGLEFPEADTLSEPDMDFVGDREFRNLAAFKLDILVGVTGVSRRLESSLERVDRATAARLGTPIVLPAALPQATGFTWSWKSRPGPLPPPPAGAPPATARRTARIRRRAGAS
ncbi:hypothetical protein BH23GEM11_BH23GEM11_12520 [soil metagenome]